MALSRNALLLFCKPPVPGLVKTRLTETHGGSLTDEEAAEFFRCSLLDVSELAMLAFNDLEAANKMMCEEDITAPVRSYDFFVSSISEEAIGILKNVYKDDGPWSHEIHFLCDKGASFDEHFDDAFDQIFALGYDNVVAVGGDMPLLPRSHIVDSFNLLDSLSAQNDQGYAFVQAPCQQSGVSVVGKTRTTPINSQGIYYSFAGIPALDAYAEKLREEPIPNAFLNPVSDIDNDADLAHAISCLNAIAEASWYQGELFLARRVLEWVDRMGLQVTAPPNDAHDPRQYIDESAR